MSALPRPLRSGSRSREFVSDLPAFGANYFSGPAAAPVPTVPAFEPPQAYQAPAYQAPSLGGAQSLKPSDDPSPYDPSENPTGPAEQKKACKDSGGTWHATGPYGQGYCEANAAAPCPQGPGWARNGSGECIELFPGDDDPNTNGCGPNQHWDEAQKRCVNGPKSESTSTTSSSNTSSTPSQTAPAPFEKWVPPAKTPFEIDFEKQLQDFLNNWDKAVPYTDSVVANLKTNNFKSAYGRAGANRDAADADAISRGVFRSSGRDRRIDSINQSADETFSTGEREIDNTATQANFQAQMTNRLAALDRAQQHVDREREYLMTSEMNQFARQSKLAELALAYYQIAAQKSMLQSQLNQSKYQFDTSLDWAKTQFEWDMLNQTGA